MSQQRLGAENTTGLVKVYQSSSCSSLKCLSCSSKNTTFAICSSCAFSSVHRSSCFCSSLLIRSLSCRCSETCKVRKHHDSDFLWSHGNLLSSIRQSGGFHQDVACDSVAKLLWFFTLEDTRASPFLCLGSSCM